MKNRKSIAYMSLILSSLLWILFDPNQGFVQDLPFGSTLAVLILYLSRAVFFWTAAHLMRKTMFPYVDFKKVYESSITTSTGAGLFSVGFGLIMIAVSVVVFAAISG